MDERYDMVRTVRDQRYIYIRNYMPHKIYGQHVAYMFVTPTTQKWHDLYHAGKLNAAQSHFWKTKPAEELYDITADPYEWQNLAGDPKLAEVQSRLRAQLDRWMKAQGDRGQQTELEALKHQARRRNNKKKNKKKPGTT